MFSLPTNENINPLHCHRMILWLDCNSPQICFWLWLHNILELHTTIHLHTKTQGCLQQNTLQSLDTWTMINIMITDILKSKFWLLASLQPTRILYMIQVVMLTDMTVILSDMFWYNLILIVIILMLTYDSDMIKVFTSMLTDRILTCFHHQNTYWYTDTILCKTYSW